jgi:hypothetical protein
MVQSDAVLRSRPPEAAVNYFCGVMAGSRGQHENVSTVRQMQVSE